MTPVRTVLAALAALACAALPAVGQQRNGHTNYVLRCAGCHGMDGAGSANGGIPDFRGLVGAFAGDDDGRTYVMHVPGVVGSGLSDAEIAGVMNYVFETWGEKSLPAPYVPFTPDEVTARRARPVDDVVAFRRDVVEKLSAQGISTADYPWP